MIKNRIRFAVKMGLAGMMVLNAAGCGKTAPSTVQPAVESAVKDVVEEVKEEAAAEPEPEEETETQEPEEEPVEEKPYDNFSLKPSPDKYTQYIDKYVGMNAANVGYTSLGGDRMIRIGDGLLEITYVTADGSYVGIDDEEALRNYVIVAQSIEPNTEVKFDFEKDSDGNEYDSLVEHQSYEKIDLLVKEIGSEDPDITLTAINPSPDKYTFYISDYVGKNVRNIGYISLGGDCRDRYGDANVLLNLVAEDGSYIDVEDETILQQYVVTGQNVAPNSEMKMTYEVDSDGNEYGNLVDTQTYDAITLTVRPVTDGPVVSKKEAETEKAQEEKPAEAEAADNGSASEGYEAIYNDYAEQIRNRTQSLLEEYRSESAGQTLDKKAEICNKKVEVLATINNEGVEKMADHMLHGGDSGGYSEWSGKLMDVYMEESQKIMTEYMDTAI